MMRGVRRLARACVAIAVGVPVAAPAGAEPRPVGPDTGFTATLRQLRPYGTLVKLGNFPGGSAVTPDGRFYWSVSAGWSGNDVRIVCVRTRRVVQVVRLPGMSGGVAFDPRRRIAY